MSSDLPEFRSFPSIARLSREVIVTEKIDGSNAQVCVLEDGRVLAGSRSRWITPENDNFGFALWVQQHEDELRTLGPGHHFGEWWGVGINRGYGLSERRFSMFNVQRWVLHGEEPGEIATQDPRITKRQQVLPPCCGLVPVICNGEFHTGMIDAALEVLRLHGSCAAPGYMKPEGVVVYHTAGNVLFKKTLEKDEMPKSTYRKKESESV